MSYSIREESRVEVNKLVLQIMALKYVLFVLAYMLLSWYGVNDSVFDLTRRIFLIAFLLSATLAVVACRAGLEKTWVTRLLVGESIASSTLGYFIFSRYVIFFLTIPLLISTRTFEKKENRRVALITWLCYLSADILNIVLDSRSPLIHSLHIWLDSDFGYYPAYVLRTQIIPTAFLFIMTVKITDSISRTGRRLMKKEIEDASRLAVMDSELGLCAKLQKDILPAGYFRAERELQSSGTEKGGVEVRAAEVPAREVSGDFYDYFMLDKTHLAFIVADVSDKGVSAAMFMMKSYTILRNALQTVEGLEDAVTSANRLISDKNASNFFLTLWVGVVDISDYSVEFVNCGHPLPFCLSASGTFRTLDSMTNSLVGCFPGAAFRSCRAQFAPGDRLVLFTDGVTDILDVNGAAFTAQRLGATVASGTTDPSGIVAACKAFAGAAAQFDDMTVLELRFL